MPTISEIRKNARVGDVYQDPTGKVLLVLGGRKGYWMPGWMYGSHTLAWFKERYSNREGFWGLEKDNLGYYGPVLRKIGNFLRPQLFEIIDDHIATLPSSRGQDAATS